MPELEAEQSLIARLGESILIWAERHPEEQRPLMKILIDALEQVAVEPSELERLTTENERLNEWIRVRVLSAYEIIQPDGKLKVGDDVLLDGLRMLKAERDEARKERDAAHAHACEASLEERDLRATTQRLREALEKYGWHKPTCGQGTPGDCTCGLDAALKEQP